MLDFTKAEIQAYYATRVPGLRQTSKREWRCPCPVHNGKRESFSVNAENGMATCHSECGKGWDIISLEMEFTNGNFAAAKASAYKIIGRPDPSWEDRDVEAAYDYTDENGRLVYQVVRRFGKKFAQRRPNGAGGWIWGLGDAKPLPYRLVNWMKEPFVAIVEGEKDVHSLESIGMYATCNSGGAGNFHSGLAFWFGGKDIAIFPDNDDAGRQHALKVAAILEKNTKSIKIVELPGLPAKGDVTDFIRSGKTRDDLRVLYAQAQPWSKDFEFGLEVPDENDQFVRTFVQVLEECGGLEKFWTLTEQKGIPTPFPKLTKTLRGGMRNGEVYVIGGNQGSGKTSLALQFVLEALRHDVGVLLFSMEMGWRDVFQRIVAIDAKVDLLEFYEAQAGKYPTTMRMTKALSQSSLYLARAPLLVSTRTRVSPKYLADESSRLKKRNKVDLVVIDHMQLMGATGTVRGDYEKFTAISRATKETAKILDVPLLIVSQTSRANSKDHRSELNVDDLRGSGAIEEDAAGVMLLYQDRDDAERCLADNTFAKGPVKSWLKLGKNRFGLQGCFLPLRHMKGQTRFEVCNSEEEGD